MKSSLDEVVAEALISLAEPARSRVYDMLRGTMFVMQGDSANMEHVVDIMAERLNKVDPRSGQQDL